MTTDEPDDLAAYEVHAIARFGAERWARAKAEARRRYRALAAYHRRIRQPGSPLSSKHRAGSRANKHRRTVPTFASDRRTAA